MSETGWNRLSLIAVIMVAVGAVLRIIDTLLEITQTGQWAELSGPITLLSLFSLGTLIILAGIWQEGRVSFRKALAPLFITVLLLISYSFSLLTGP